MAYIKTQEEIEKLAEGGKILGEILEKLGQMTKPGVSAFDIDAEAEKMILEVGGKPAFKNYKNKPADPPFPSTICASINEELVHGIATKEKVLKEGDVFSIDIGMEWPLSSEFGVRSSEGKGYFTDTSVTVPVGEITEEVKQLLGVTKKALEVGIGAVKIGNTIADIGKAIEEFVQSAGKYGIVRDLVGHGVGHEVHEDPRVPNFYDKKLEEYSIEPGVVIAIEPMITLGDYKIATAEDGWGISTIDGSLCAHFEHTVAVTENGEVIVPTRRPSELG